MMPQHRAVEVQGRSYKERWNGPRMSWPCAVEVHVSCCPTANLLTKSIKRENSTAQGRGISEDSVAVW